MWRKPEPPFTPSLGPLVNPAEKADAQSFLEFCIWLQTEEAYQLLLGDLKHGNHNRD